MARLVAQAAMAVLVAQAVLVGRMVQAPVAVLAQAKLALTAQMAQ